MNIANEHGNTPLHYACFWSYEEICRVSLIKSMSLSDLCLTDQTFINPNVFFYHQWLLIDLQVHLILVKVGLSYICLCCWQVYFNDSQLIIFILNHDWNGCLDL